LIIAGFFIQFTRLLLFTLFGGIRNPLFYISVQMLMGTAFSSYITGIVPMLDRKSPPEMKAIYQNLYHVVSAIALVPANFFSTLIVDNWGTIPLMAVCGVGMFAGLLYCLVFLKDE